MKTRSERREVIRNKRRGHTVHQSFLRVTRALAERYRIKKEATDGQKSA